MEVADSVIKKLVHDIKSGRKASKKLKEFIKECISTSKSVGRK